MLVVGILAYLAGIGIDLLNVILGIRRIRGTRQSGIALIPFVCYVIGAIFIKQGGYASYYGYLIVAGLVIHLICFGGMLIVERACRRIS